MLKCQFLDLIASKVSVVNYGEISRVMERNQEARVSMMADRRMGGIDPGTLQGLGVDDCSGLRVNDDLCGLFRRQELINKEIKCSLQELCGQLRADSRTQSVGRGCVKSGAYGPGRQMPGAQRMMAIGRGGALKKNLVSNNPGMSTIKPEH